MKSVREIQFPHERRKIMSKFFLLSSVIVLNVLGHVFLKAGMNKIGGISPSQLLSNFAKVFSTPFVISGLFCYVFSVGMYMVVLSEAHLSYAHSLLTSSAYIFIILVSWQIFKEPFSTLKWLRILLIFAGVILIGK
jgi:multidrug transporter EmrE-like cation transporter